MNFEFELQAAATDEGLELSIGDKHSFPLDAIFSFLNSKADRICVLVSSPPSRVYRSRKHVSSYAYTNNPHRTAMESAKSRLSVVGLSHRFHHKPGELSGGEQQRVAVARALIRQPNLVLADEPTGNLDTHTGEELFELLQKLNETHGTAFVIVTHNEKLSQQTHRLIHLQDGQILEDRYRS